MFTDRDPPRGRRYGAGRLSRPDRLFFAATGPGLATLVWLAQKLGGGTLALESGQGRLASDFTLKRLRIMAEGTELERGELQLS